MNKKMYISNISVSEYRTIKDLNINVESLESKNIILTGKNGSGKTTLLSLIHDKFKYKYLGEPQNSKWNSIDKIDLTYSDEFKCDKDFVFSYLKADRTLVFQNEKIKMSSYASYKYFYKYLVSLLISTFFEFFTGAKKASGKDSYFLNLS